jgi:IS30 family transposase
VRFATLAERKSRLYLALPIANKTAQNANDAINKLLTPLNLGKDLKWGLVPQAFPRSIIH